MFLVFFLAGGQSWWKQRHGITTKVHLKKNFFVVTTYLNSNLICNLMPFWQPVNVCLKWNESSSCLRKGSAFTWHIYSPYTSNVTNRELLLLGTDPQPKLGSATFSTAYLHQRGNTDLNQQRVSFDGAPVFWLLNDMLWERHELATSFLAFFMPLWQNWKISMFRCTLLFLGVLYWSCCKNCTLDQPQTSSCYWLSKELVAFLKHMILRTCKYVF